MPTPRYAFILVCALLGACGSEPPPAKLPDALKVFPNLPLPPSSQFVSRSGSEDALQIQLVSATRPEDVTEYYRDALSKGKWRLVSDIKNKDGSVVLYAEQDGTPIWVRIWPTSDSASTMVELAGAVVGRKADSVR